MKFTTGLVAILVEMASPLAGKDADWRVTTLDEIGASFVEANSIQQAGSRITFWYQVHFRDKANIARLVSQASADCEDQSLSDIVATGYRADGFSADLTNRSRRRVPPGSNLAGLLDRACRAAWLGEGPVDPASFAREFFKSLDPS